MSAAIDKVFVDAQSLLKDSYVLAAQIINSGFRPDFIVGVWRGGAPIGVAVQEFCDYNGIKSDHIAIRTSSYTGLDQANREVKVHGLDYIVNRVSKHHSLLIVDDVFDSGRSIAAIMDRLERRCRDNLPNDIRVATVYSKPERIITDFGPDYYVHETDAWLVFPHEMSGLERDELVQNRPWLAEILDSVDK